MMWHSLLYLLEFCFKSLSKTICVFCVAIFWTKTLAKEGPDITEEKWSVEVQIPATPCFCQAIEHRVNKTHTAKGLSPCSSSSPTPLLKLANEFKGWYFAGGMTVRRSMVCTFTPKCLPSQNPTGQLHNLTTRQQKSFPLYTFKLY